MSLRFYLDENINPIVADQLKLHGIDAVSVKELGKLGDSDPDHLARATGLERVLCTHDQDFLRLVVDHKSFCIKPHPIDFSIAPSAYLRGKGGEIGVYHLKSQYPAFSRLYFTSRRASGI